MWNAANAPVVSAYSDHENGFVFESEPGLAEILDDGPALVVLRRD